LEKVVEEELPATGDEFVHNEDLPAQNNNNNQDEKESSDKNSGKLELKFKNLFNRFKNAMTYKEDDDEDDLI
jgi:hypothetical protein